jgi:transposase-like protein
METEEERKERIKKLVSKVSMRNVNRRIQERIRRKEEEAREKGVRIFCKFCGYDSATKWGFRHTLSKSIQIYRCKKCGHRFTDEKKSIFVTYPQKRHSARGIMELENLIITKFKNKQLDKTSLSRKSINKLREELKKKVGTEDLPSPPTFINKIKKALAKNKFDEEDYKIIKFYEKNSLGKRKKVKLYVFLDRQHY